LLFYRVQSENNQTNVTYSWKIITTPDLFGTSLRRCAMLGIVSHGEFKSTKRDDALIMFHENPSVTSNIIMSEDTYMITP